MAKVKIEKKIIDCKVDSTKSHDKSINIMKEYPEGGKEKETPESKVVRMHERLERPVMLRGSTYKIKPPISDHAMYITINDIVLNPNTDHEKYRWQATKKLSTTVRYTPQPIFLMH